VSGVFVSVAVSIKESVCADKKQVKKTKQQLIIILKEIAGKDKNGDACPADRELFIIKDC